MDPGVPELHHGDVSDTDGPVHHLRPDTRNQRSRKGRDGRAYDVAQATADLVVGGGFVGESVFLTGPAAVDLYEVAATFTEVLGHDVTYNDVTDDDFANLLISAGATRLPRRISV